MRVPLPAQAGVAQPEGARQVEYARPPGGKRRSDFGRERVGKREEHRVRFTGEALDVERLDGSVPDPRQARDPLRLGTARRHGISHVRIGVARQAAQELETGIAGCPRDPHPYARIVMHQNQ
jgi:hypothetical protein